MLESLFGNSTAEKCLFYLRNYGQGYARAISSTFGVSLTAVQQQLRRLERGGIIASQLVGRTRLYRFNPRYPFLDELNGLLGKAMDFLPAEEVAKYYRQRTRPRRAGKP